MIFLRSSKGSTLIELLCSLVIIATLGGLIVSVVLTVAKRGADHRQRDSERRMSERVFGTVADGVRAQREAPGILLWRLLDGRHARGHWPESIPPGGPRAPHPDSPLLLFARLESTHLWQVIREHSTPPSTLAALALCRRPLFTQRARSDAANQFFLGITADRVLLLHGKVVPARLSTSRCLATTAAGSVARSDRFWPFASERNGASKELAVNAVELIALRPVADGFALYLDNARTVRRAALLTAENQPVAAGIAALQIDARPLGDGREVELFVDLLWGEVGALRSTEQRWILPVPTIGGQLIGAI